MTNVVETAMRRKTPSNAVTPRAAHDPESVYLHYHRLVRQIARRVFMTVSSALPMEDLVQIGSIALLEASAAGCAIVASRVGGNPEIVAEGERGRLFESEDAAGLQAVLAEVLAGAAQRRRLGDAARA